MSSTGIAGPGGIAGGNLIEEIEEAGGPRPIRRRQRPRAWRIVILVIALLFYGIPFAAAVKYSLIESNGSFGFSNYSQIISDSAVRDSLYTSLAISAITAIVVVGLMLPTVVLVRLRLPKLTLALEGITILPLVVPPIVIAAGLAHLQGSAPLWLVKLWFNHPITGLAPTYVVLAMPFTFRALDTGVRAIDLRTLVDASRSLGASWLTTLVRVILPNVETAVLGAIFLTVALCMGEVVLSSLMLYNNVLPVEMISVGASSPGVSVAISVLALVFVFLLLFSLSFIAGRRRGSNSVRVI